MAKLLRDRLPARVRHLLELAGRLGQRLNMPVYVVGGFVRDLLLDRPNHDVDFVVEGEGVTFARALAAELGGRVREHRKFLTSMVIYHDEDGLEQRIDVATARLEYYESPAALPTVELSSIKMDLFRRDFTINALAIRLDSPGPVVFHQKRFGKDRKLFEIYKFRTMRVDAPRDVPTNDLRGSKGYITRVGRILRMTSLDELRGSLKTA